MRRLLINIACIIFYWMLLSREATIIARLICVNVLNSILIRCLANEMVIFFPSFCSILIYNLLRYLLLNGWMIDTVFKWSGRESIVDSHYARYHETVIFFIFLLLLFYEEKKAFCLSTKYNNRIECQSVTLIPLEWLFSFPKKGAQLPFVASFFDVWVCSGVCSMYLFLLHSNITRHIIKTFRWLATICWNEKKKMKRFNDFVLFDRWCLRRCSRWRYLTVRL